MTGGEEGTVNSAATLGAALYLFKKVVKKGG